MKRYVKFSILLVFLCAAAFASFSGNYLCVRRGGVTYKHKLYTSTADVGSPRMGVRVGGATRYAKLLSASATDAGYLRVRHSGTTYGVSQFYGSTSIFNASGSSALAAGANYYYVVDSINSMSVKKYTKAGALVSTFSSVGYYGGSLFADASDNFYSAYQTSGIKKYNSSGTLLTTYSGVTTTRPYHCFVDLSGNVYMCNSDSDYVTDHTFAKWNSSGTLLATKKITEGTWAGGIVVDSSGNVYTCLSNTVLKYNSSFNYVTSFSISGVRGTAEAAIAIDDQDRIYVTAGTTPNYNITVIDTAGNVLGAIYTGADRATAIAFDRATKDVVARLGYNHTVYK